MTMRFAWCLSGSLILAIAGCGESSDRLAFSGNVTVAGLPVTGAIRFIPVENGPMATTGIDNGRYQFTNVTGPLPGDYSVMIESLPATVKKGATAEIVIPQEWKVKRRIEAGVEFETDFSLEHVSETVAE